MPRKAATGAAKAAASAKKTRKTTSGKAGKAAVAPDSPAPAAADAPASTMSPSGRSKRTSRKSRSAPEQVASPAKKGVVFTEGTRIDAQDYLGSWYAARIIEVDESAKKALVHFERWNKRFDEWFEFGSPRIRPFGTGTEGDAEVPASVTSTGRPSRAKRASTATEPTDNADSGTRRRKNEAASPAALSSPKTSRIDSAAQEPIVAPAQAATVARTPVESTLSTAGPAVVTTFPCTVQDCNKSFRKASLLESHMRHYHEAETPGHASPSPLPTARRQKRPSSDDGTVTVETGSARRDSRQKSKRARLEPPIDVGLPAEDNVLRVPSESADRVKAPEQLGPEGSVTQCLCGFNDESEYMIQCERCSAWQHVDCIGIRAGEEPERYHCFGCVKLQTVLEKDLSGTRWLRLGRKRIDDVPILPTSAKDINWGSETLDHVLEPRGRKVTADGDPAHVQQLLMTQRNIGSDLAILERCLRSLRLALSKLAFQSSDVSKRRMEEFERHQYTIEHHIEQATLDMDTLDAVVQALVAHDKVNLCARVSKAPAGSVPEPSMSRQRAIAQMQELYTKYNQRQWKTYVVTAEGRALR